VLLSGRAVYVLGLLYVGQAGNRTSSWKRRGKWQKPSRGFAGHRSSSWRASEAARVIARIAQRQGCQTAAVVTRPLPWEGLDALAYALVTIKMLAGVDRLVTVPLVELRRGASEVEVRRAAGELAR
jgi:hypothetical protein